jgi:hypothetical protein
VLPVLGTMPSTFGMAMAAYVLCQLAQQPFVFVPPCIREGWGKRCAGWWYGWGVCVPWSASLHGKGGDTGCSRVPAPHPPTPTPSPVVFGSLTPQARRGAPYVAAQDHPHPHAAPCQQGGQGVWQQVRGCGWPHSRSPRVPLPNVVTICHSPSPPPLLTSLHAPGLT